MTSHAAEERIGTVDVWRLRRAAWPILRVFARHYVEQMELGRYMRELLATRRWSSVRVVPHVDASGLPSTHVFDVFGVPTIG